MDAERWMRLEQAGRNVDAIGSLMEELIALIDAELGASRCPRLYPCGTLE